MGRVGQPWETTHGGKVQKPRRSALLSEGRAARLRAQQRDGRSNRIGTAAWYPEVRSFQERGWTVPWIAEALVLSTRQVERIIEQGNRDRRAVYDIPVERKLPADLKAMLEFTPEAYEIFFTTFSGHDHLPPHAREWIRLFIEHPNLMLHVPPNHSKTTIMAIWLTVWLIVRDRNTQVLIVSQTNTQAKNIARSIANILSQPALTRAFGRLVPTPADDEPWQVEQGQLMVLGRTRRAKPGDLTVMSRGMGQSVLSFRADVIICDDITSAEAAFSPTEHAKELAKYRGEIATRIDPEVAGEAAGRALMIGQRVAFNDLYSELHEDTYAHGEKAGEFLWHVEVQKALPTGWEGESLWPERWPIERLARLHATMGSALFDCMYQQEPIAEGELPFPMEMVDRCRTERPLGQGPEGEGWIRVASVDPSPTMYNAAIIADVAYDGDKWRCEIVDVQEWKGGEAVLRRRIHQWRRIHRITHLVIEDSAVSKTLLDSEWFRELESELTVVRHQTQTNKNDQLWGVESLATEFEFRRIGLPCGDAEGRAATEILTRQLKVYPYTKVFDAIMALWFLKWNRKKLRVKKRKLDHFRGLNRGPNSSGREWVRKRKNVKKNITQVSSIDLTSGEAA